MKDLLTIALLLSLVLPACDDFLNQEPQDEISKDDALDDIFSLEFALNGAYNGVIWPEEYYGEFMLYYGDLLGGNIKPSPNLTSSSESVFNLLYGFNVVEEDNLENYPKMYAALNRVNNVINAVPGLPDGTQQDKDQILGEALSLRALVHFDLVRVFSQPYNFTPDASHLGIVLLEESPNPDEEIARSTVAEVYQRIIDDLEQAITLLPDNHPVNRFSQLSAQALLARVYLYSENYTKAVSLATEVINNPMTQLASREQYPDIWDNEFLTTEHLLRFDNMVSEKLTLSAIWGTAINDEPPDVTISTDLLNLYDSADIRGPLSMIDTLVVEDKMNIVTRKYIVEELVGNNVPVIRLSEVYLIRAEAYAELGRNELSQDDLNAIRQRANPLVSDVTLTGAGLIDEILKEKRRELAFEGHYLFDLNRKKTGVLRNDCDTQTVRCSLDYPNERFVQPLPLVATDGNDRLKQNDGY